MEYRIAIFVLSFLLAVVLIFNVKMVKIIYDVTAAAVGRSIVRVGNMGFDYGIERGPHTWSFDGDHQSPINIIYKNVEKLPIRELLTWNHYDDLPSSITIENTGHTIVVKADFSGNTPSLCGADLLASYSFMQICFRWNLLNNEGSEHMINYQKFPLELQAMHRTGPDGDCISRYDLLMVAYFFEISGHNPYLDPLIQNLNRVKIPGSKIRIPPFPLSYLCYQFRSGFYSYGGSLTEPPCYEGAEWFVYPEPFAISESQLNKFRKILGSNGATPIIRNARPVQNSRTVNVNDYHPLHVDFSLNSNPSQDSTLD